MSEGANEMHGSSHLTDWIAALFLVNPLGLAHQVASQMHLTALETALAHIAAIIGPIGQMIGLFLLLVKVWPYFRRATRARLREKDEE